MQIKHHNGSLFDADVGSFLVHACNTRGVWGSGIAKEFKKRFPKSYEEYNTYCMSEARAKRSIAGKTLVTSENIVCLMTSDGYGAGVDYERTILINTLWALDDFICEALKTQGEVRHIHSNKFNSGLFNVPWEQTERVLRMVLKAYPNITWHLHTPPEYQPGYGKTLSLGDYKETTKPASRVPRFFDKMVSCSDTGCHYA